MENYISLKDENENEKKYEILLTYLSPNTQKKYIVYKINDDEVCANFYDEYSNELGEIVNSEDWEEIEMIINKHLEK